MKIHERSWNRRDFMLSTLGAGLAGTLGPSIWGGLPEVEKQGIKLGFDNFSVRAFGWKAKRLIDYAAELKVDTLLLSDINVYDSYEATHLADVRAHAERSGVELHAGTGSICPTSASYDEKKWGPAEDHLRLLIRIARGIGSPVVRCYLGSRRDRDGDGGIYRHIDSTVKVLKTVRSEAIDAGVKIAVENHAGDMQAWELVTLIEAAGTEYVGATMDSGNATWTLEHPMVNLEVLGPHAVSAGIRDSAVWETERGASVMWANMGDGSVDWQAYVERYKELCPKTPFVLEILSYSWAKELPYLEPEMWNVFPRARAHEFARFVALARAGKKYEIPEGRPRGPNSRELTQAQQKFDLEASLRYSKEVLGLGLKT